MPAGWKGPGAYLARLARERTTFVAHAAAAEFDTRDLHRYLRRYRSNLAEAKPAIRRANEQTVEWMSQQAYRELRRRVRDRGRPQKPQRNLERVLSNPHLHSTWTDEGFEFWRAAQVNRTNVKAYWRVIEEGSPNVRRWMVERPQGLLFMRGGRWVGPQFGAADVVIVAKRGTGGAFPRWRVPIEPYEYLDHAREQLRGRDMYTKIVRRNVYPYIKSLRTPTP